MPHGATRPKNGKRAVVSSAHPLASAAGLRILKQGGNAVDAAVAASLALGVVAPAFSGLGGGGFMLIRPKGGETVYLDYREVAARASRPGMFKLDDDGGPAGFANSMGHLAVAVPGTVAGLTRALDSYGRLKFGEVAAPAIRYARRGFEVSRFFGLIMSNNVDNATLKIRSFPETSRNWLTGARTFRPGERVSNRELAASLEMVARDGAGAFYGGPIGRAIAREMSENGGLIDESDLSRYSVKERKPVGGSYRGLEVQAMPPPSLGGIAIIQLLNVFENMDLGATGLNTPETIAAMARALAVVFPALRKEIGDPDFVPLDVPRLCSKEHAAKLWFGRGERGTAGGRGPGSETTHLSVIDEEGNVAAITESVECYFGSGVTVPGTGIILNDTMHDFDPAPGIANSIAPGKRPASNMTPTLLLKDGEPYLVAGSAAGPRIVTATLQTILNVVDHALSLQRAVDAPRIHFQGAGAVRMESRIGPEVRRRLRKLGFESETPNYLQLREGFDVYFGGVHAALVGRHGERVGAADPRRQGSVAAY
jgi:gamma-glutamyltranspeptidase/glutathione hydrolase